MISGTVEFPVEYDYRSRGVVSRQVSEILTAAGLGIGLNSDITRFFAEATERKAAIAFAFDLKQTTYISLEQLLEIASLGRFCFFLTGRKVEVLLPVTPRVVRSFLLPWGFLDTLHLWGTAEVEIRRFDENSHFRGQVPMRSIRDLADVRGTARDLKKPRVATALRDRFGFQEAERNLLVDGIIAEVCDNIPNHSLSEGTIAAQIHRSELDRVTVPEGYEPNMDIVVSDAGVGIFQSLRKKYPSAYSDKYPRHALLDALNGLTPQPPGEFHGGIMRMKEAVLDLHGLFEIRIPFARVKVTGAGKQVFRESHFFPGTHVAIKIPRSSLLG